MNTHEATSNKVLEEIDSEVRRFVTEGYQKATAILREKRHTLDLMTEALLIRESMGIVEIDAIMAGDPLITDEEQEEYKKRINQKNSEWGLKKRSPQTRITKKTLRILAK